MCPLGTKRNGATQGGTLEHCVQCPAGKTCAGDTETACLDGYLCLAFTPDVKAYPAQPGDFITSAGQTVNECQYGYCMGANSAEVLCPDGYGSDFAATGSYGQYSKSVCQPNEAGTYTAITNAAFTTLGSARTQACSVG